MPKNVEDYLEKGIHGVKEPNALEKEKYLGTYRERIVIVMTKPEVLAKKGLPILAKKMKRYPKAKLLLNGNLEYNAWRPYIALAEQNKIPFSIVSSKGKEADVYLVLTCPKEINLPHIHLPEEAVGPHTHKESNKQKKRSFLEKIKAFLK